MTTDEKQAHLEGTKKDLGFTLELHNIMVEADLDWVKAFDPFVDATYTGQRTLDRKTKELLQFVIMAALRAEMDHIRAHVRVALDYGATPREILEALEAVMIPMGMLSFRRGVQAWALETGFQVPEEVNEA